MLAGFVACGDSSTGPEDPGEIAPPVLGDVAFTPDSVDVSTDTATVEASVQGESGYAVDSATVVLASPSGADRVRCLARKPDEGNALDGVWRCSLLIPPGVERGTWLPDSVGIFSNEGAAGTRIWTGDDLTPFGVELIVTWRDSADVTVRVVEELTLGDAAGTSFPDILDVRVEEALSLTETVRADSVSMLDIVVSESLTLSDAVVTEEAATVLITAPDAGTTVQEGGSIVFTASASDADGTDVSGQIAWSSNLDGPLGTGPSISAVLSPGAHTVTAAVAISGGGTVSATVTVGVGTLSAGTLYGVDSGTDALHRIEPVTGGSVQIGTRLGSSFDTPVAMAIMPASEEVLVWNNSPSRELVSVDICTGEGTSLGSYSSVNQIGALAARADGVLFGFTDDQLFRIDMGEAGRPLTIVRDGLPVRVGGADFTPDGRLFGFELTIDLFVRLVEIDPANGDVLQSMQITDPSGLPVSVGVAGSLTWNPATGAFLASSIRGYDGIGEALFDLSPAGIATNPRAQSGAGDQGMGFRSIPACAGSPPTLSIEAPGDGAVYQEGARVYFEGLATDPEDGSLFAIRWFSDLDGFLSSGSIVSWLLSPGVHEITAAVMDSDGNSDLATIIVVMGSTPVEMTVTEALSVEDGPSTEVVPGEPAGAPILLRVQESIGVSDGGGSAPEGGG